MIIVGANAKANQGLFAMSAVDALWFLAWDYHMVIL
jgi:hypothetical protein